MPIGSYYSPFSQKDSSSHLHHNVVNSWCRKYWFKLMIHWPLSWSSWIFLSKYTRNLMLDSYKMNCCSTPIKSICWILCKEKPFFYYKTCLFSFLSSQESLFLFTLFFISLNKHFFFYTLFLSLLFFTLIFIHLFFIMILFIHLFFKAIYFL